MGHALHMTPERLASIQARIAKASRSVSTHTTAGEARGPCIEPRKSKYHNVKTLVDGIMFDSKREADRYCELKLLAAGREIVELRRQVRYPINIRGVMVTTYVADFVYKTRGGLEVVEDAKGVRTDAYKIKKKLVKALHGIDIVEV